MQTLSRLQRNFTHQKTLTKLLLLAGLILFYPPLSSLYPLLPPLTGIAYLQWRNHMYERDYLLIGAWMLYAVVLEAEWGLPLYGLWGTMFFLYFFLEPKIEHYIHSPWLVDMLAAALFDLLYFLFVIFYGALVHQRFIEADPILWYYLLIDMMGAILF